MAKKKVVEFKEASALGRIELCGDRDFLKIGLLINLNSNTHMNPIPTEEFELI
jgi:hypothetical protein